MANSTTKRSSCLHEIILLCENIIKKQSRRRQLKIDTTQETQTNKRQYKEKTWQKKSSYSCLCHGLKLLFTLGGFSVSKLTGLFKDYPSTELTITNTEGHSFTCWLTWISVQCLGYQNAKHTQYCSYSLQSTYNILLEYTKHIILCDSIQIVHNSMKVHKAWMTMTVH